jgi:hypothetical protein
MITNTIKNEIISILNAEIDTTNNNEFKARLFNEIQKIKYWGGKDGKIQRIDVGYNPQIHINFMKRLQFIYLTNFKYNKNLSNETISFLDNRVASSYKKIGKMVNKINKNRK